LAFTSRNHAGGPPVDSVAAATPPEVPRNAAAVRAGA
jgi:hypothetical protein